MVDFILTVTNVITIVILKKIMYWVTIIYQMSCKSLIHGIVWFVQHPYGVVFTLASQKEQGCGEYPVYNLWKVCKSFHSNIKRSICVMCLHACIHLIYNLTYNNPKTILLLKNTLCWRRGMEAIKRQANKQTNKNNSTLCLL